MAMRDTAADEDIVLIHDRVRPLIDERLLTENIDVAREHGAASHRRARRGERRAGQRGRGHRGRSAPG